MSDNPTKKEEGKLEPWENFTNLLILVITLWLGLFIAGCIWKGVPRSLNEIGDSFGAVNALFSGIALAGIVYTIIIQRKELKLQREELKLTREEWTSSP